MSLWLLKLSWREDEVITLTRAYLLLQFYHQTPIQVYACSSSSRSSPGRSFCCSCNERPSRVDHLEKSCPLCCLCAQIFQKLIFNVLCVFFLKLLQNAWSIATWQIFLLYRKHSNCLALICVLSPDLTAWTMPWAGSTLLLSNHLVVAQ